MTSQTEGSYTDPKQCASVGCDNSFMPHAWGAIKSHDKGWFHQKNGDSWCPDHTPEWVAEWRQRTQQNIKGIE